MADVPRDPRQLARDILSGKIRIEDLARERQMRAGGARPPANAPSPAHTRMAPPPQVPSTPPRTPMPARVPAQPFARPVNRPLPAPQQRMQPQARPGSGSGGGAARGPGQLQVAPGAVPTRKAERPQAAPDAGQTKAYAMPPGAAAAAPAALANQVSTRPGPVTRRTLREMARSRTALRQGMVLAEILGKPVALRDD